MDAIIPALHFSDHREKRFGKGSVENEGRKSGDGVGAVRLVEIGMRGYNALTDVAKGWAALRASIIGPLVSLAGVFYANRRGRPRSGRIQ